MYIRIPTDRTLRDVDNSFLGALGTPTSQMLDGMTCRLLCASALSYANPKALTADQKCYYANGGFTQPPHWLSIKGGIDSCILGLIQGPSAGPGLRSIVLAFRGTVGPLENAWDWLNNLEAAPISFKTTPTIVGAEVLKGFNDSQDLFFRGGLLDKIQALRAEAPEASVYLTGHSKGGALAHIVALRLRTNNPDIPLAGVISFEAPRCGNRAFAQAYRDTRIPSLRYEFQDDMVPHLPPTGDLFATLLNVNVAAQVALRVFYPKSSREFAYEHVGELKFIDWTGEVRSDSPELRSERMSRLIAAIKSRTFDPFALHAIDRGSGHWNRTCQAIKCA